MKPTAPALAAAALLLVTAGPAAARVDPEGDDRKPGQDAGWFAGYPSPTARWHGCSRFASYTTPVTRDDGVPATAAGRAQSTVTWTLTQPSAASAGYTVAWQVASGWKVCGVQVAALGSDPSKDFDLALQAGYPSQGTRGSTATSGAESVRVELSKREAQEAGFDAPYAGDYAISKIYAVYVFVKKAGKR